MLHFRDIWKMKPFWVFIALMTFIFVGANASVADDDTQSDDTSISHPIKKYTDSRLKTLSTKQSTKNQVHSSVWERAFD
ncbi:riboflavin biosynthesis protein RibD [Fructobacillus pseudoficulneus]|uniref:Riboflavin biosynthesis protein RibD n=1 Tax=Fructobacillus pseudoficulneus TaxID=220714 RepID=A0A3F3H9D5_9LACO|nr:hypothetical protein [Fructobacillus pseudoficulneus]GAP02873.1 riboflavin biosynthesis protein RibD [Fructobacillus pseudoficulneus]SEH45525.1 hypothetical protein SAMN05660469_1278 [Fructobacillus pseudoficulneus]